MTHERANRIAWAGWILALPFAYLAPVMRPLTGVRGSGRPAIFACVGIMLAVLFLIRKDRRAIFLAIDMSSSSLAIGATGGFVSAALLSGRPLAAVLSLKWGLASAFFVWLFKRELNAPSEPEAPKIDPSETPEGQVRARFGIAPEEDLNRAIEAMSIERRNEFEAFVEERMRQSIEEIDRIHGDLDRLHRKSRRMLILGVVALLLGAALIVWRW